MQILHKMVRQSVFGLSIIPGYPLTDSSLLRSSCSACSLRHGAPPLRSVSPACGWRRISVVALRHGLGTGLDGFPDKPGIPGIYKGNFLQKCYNFCKKIF